MRLEALKEASKRVQLGPKVLPSACMYTFFNAHGRLAGVKA